MPDKFISLTGELYDYLVAHRSERDPVLAELAQGDRGGTRSDQHDADRARAGRLHDHAGARHRRALRRRGGHVHRLQRAVRRARLARRRPLAVLRHQRGVDVDRRGATGRRPASRTRSSCASARRSRRCARCRRTRSSTWPSSTPTSPTTATTTKRSSRACDRTGSSSSTTSCGWARCSTPPTTDESTRAIQELNDFLRTDRARRAVMLPISDGLTIVRKRAPGREGGVRAEGLWAGRWLARDTGARAPEDVCIVTFSSGPDPRRRSHRCTGR